MAGRDSCMILISVCQFVSSPVYRRRKRSSCYGGASIRHQDFAYFVGLKPSNMNHYNIPSVVVGRLYARTNCVSIQGTSIMYFESTLAYMYSWPTAHLHTIEQLENQSAYLFVLLQHNPTGKSSSTINLLFMTVSCYLSAYFVFSVKVMITRPSEGFSPSSGSSSRMAFFTPWICECIDPVMSKITAA